MGIQTKTKTKIDFHDKFGGQGYSGVPDETAVAPDAAPVVAVPQIDHDPPPPAPEAPAEK